LLACISDKPAAFSFFFNNATSTCEYIFQSNKWHANIWFLNLMIKGTGSLLMYEHDSTYEKIQNKKEVHANMQNSVPFDEARAYICACSS
jgi:hypothetical protein